MKADTDQKAKGREKPGSGKPKSTPALEPPASGIYQLSRMTTSEMMEMAQRHNTQQGLVGPDQLAPVLHGVLERATCRAPPVHPFTVATPRKDQYRSAWKALSKRIGVPLFSPGAQTGGPDGGAAAAAEAAVTVAASWPAPTHAQMYGAPNDQTAPRRQFEKALASWLGIAVDIPLLAPGAPRLPLKKLFQEVQEAGGSHCAALSWSALATKLQGDAGLAEVVQQVYDAYLLPLERCLPAGTRPARVESWLGEEVRRRSQLTEVPTAEQVHARITIARAAIQTLERKQHQHQQHQHQQHQQHQHQHQQLSSTPATTATPGPAAGAAAQPGADGRQATGEPAAVGDADGGDAMDVDPTAAAAAMVAWVVPGMALGGEAGGDAKSGAAAVAAVAVVAPSPLAGDVLRMLRKAAVSARAMLGGGEAGGKRPRPTTGRGRPAAKGKGGGGSHSKRARGGGADTGGEEGEEGVEPDVELAAVVAAAEGDAPGADLLEPRVAALLSIAASLKQSQAAPPGCVLMPLPDLRANFMARWEAEQAVRVTREAVAAAAAAATASVPEGPKLGGAGRSGGSGAGDGGGGGSSARPGSEEREAGGERAAQGRQRRSEGPLMAPPLPGNYENLLPGQLPLQQVLPPPPLPLHHGRSSEQSGRMPSNRSFPPDAGPGGLPPRPTLPARAPYAISNASATAPYGLGRVDARQLDLTGGGGYGYQNVDMQGRGESGGGGGGEGGGGGTGYGGAHHQPLGALGGSGSGRAAAGYVGYEPALLQALPGEYFQPRITAYQQQQQQAGVYQHDMQPLYDVLEHIAPAPAAGGYGQAQQQQQQHQVYVPPLPQGQRAGVRGSWTEQVSGVWDGDEGGGVVGARGVGGTR